MGEQHPARRVVFVNRYFYPDESATSQILSDVAFHLSQAGHDIAVITNRYAYDDPDRQFPRRETIQGVDVIRVATTRFGRMNLAGRAIDYASFYVTSLFAALRHGGRGTVLVAKTDPPLLSVPMALAAMFTGARLATWLQDVYPEVAADLGVGFARGPIGALLRVMRNWSLNRAEINVVIGERMGALLKDNGVEADSIVEIPNWTDDEAVRPLAHADNPLREEWGFTDDMTVIGYSGNLGRAHDLETILDAANRLKHLDHIRFLFVGGGKLREMLESRIADLGLTNVVLKPYQPREHLNRSLSVPDMHWVTLIPELEGKIVPSKVYGVAAAGRPVLFIGDEDGEISRMIGANDCGESFAIGQGAHLAERILMLSADKNRQAEMGVNGRRMIESKYSRKNAFAAWDRIARKFCTRSNLRR